MADQQPTNTPSGQAAKAAATDLESNEIWGDEADQLDEEIMKVWSRNGSSRRYCCGSRK